MLTSIWLMFTDTELKPKSRDAPFNLGGRGYFQEEVSGGTWHTLLVILRKAYLLSPMLLLTNSEFPMILSCME